MIKLPNFSKCVDFKRLKDKMGVTIIPVLPPVKFVREVVKRHVKEVPNNEAIQAEKELTKGSVSVSLADIGTDKQGLLSYKGRKVVAYIRDQRMGIHYSRKYGEYRYHLCDCNTLRSMRAEGREWRYLVTKRQDGRFEVNDISGAVPRNLELTLDLCQHCIRDLKWKNLYFTPFSLGEYFKKYESDVPRTIRRIEVVKEIQTYAPNHDDIAREYKKVAGYVCQKCGVLCSGEVRLLHLHHENRNPSDYRHENLRVLCVECHSHEPHHAHLIRTQDARDGIERIKELRKAQGIVDLGLNL